MPTIEKRRHFDRAVLAAAESMGARQDFTVEQLLRLTPTPRGGARGTTAHRDAISGALARLTAHYEQLVRVSRGVYRLREEREPLADLPPPVNRHAAKAAAEREAEARARLEHAAARRIERVVRGWKRAVADCLAGRPS